MSEVEELLTKEKQGCTDKNRKNKEKKSTWAATIALVLSLVAGFASLFYLAGGSSALRSNRLKYDAAVSYLGSYKTALVVISALVVSCTVPGKSTFEKAGCRCLRHICNYFDFNFLHYLFRNINM